MARPGSAGSRCDRMTHTQLSTAGKLPIHRKATVVRASAIGSPPGRLRQDRNGRTLSAPHPVPAAPDRSGRATRGVHYFPHGQKYFRNTNVIENAGDNHMNHGIPEIERAYERYCQKRFPLPSTEEVQQLEDRINVTFPEDYRDYLLQYNGGWFRTPVLDVEDEDIHSGGRIDCMSGIGASHEVAELGNSFDMALFDDNDPPQIMIIGRTEGGHLILLDTYIPGERYGSILYKSFTETIRLASSIAEFFDLFCNADI
jgi:hypothetical protein